jgi:hypothetical protein
MYANPPRRSVLFVYRFSRKFLAVILGLLFAACEYCEKAEAQKVTEIESGLSGSPGLLNVSSSFTRQSFLV